VRQKADLFLTFFRCYYREGKSQFQPMIFLLSVHHAKPQAKQKVLLWPGLMALASAFRLAVNPVYRECIMLRIQPKKEQASLKRLAGPGTNCCATNY